MIELWQVQGAADLRVHADRAHQARDAVDSINATRSWSTTRPSQVTGGQAQRQPRRGC